MILAQTLALAVGLPERLVWIVLSLCLRQRQTGWAAGQALGLDVTSGPRSGSQLAGSAAVPVFHGALETSPGQQLCSVEPDAMPVVFRV